VCSVYPDAARQEYWPFENPAATGSEEKVQAVFRRVRDKFAGACGIMCGDKVTALRAKSSEK
jgi:hypothetical protein